MTTPTAVFNAADAWYNQGPRPMYPGEMVAGFTPFQTMGQQAQIMGAYQGIPAANYLSGFATDYLTRSQGGFGIDPSMAGQVNNIGASFNPFDNSRLDSAIASMRKSANDDFERTVLPSQRMDAIEAGQSGSSRHGIAEGIARSDLNGQLLDAENKMRMGLVNSYVSDRGNTLDAIMRQTSLAPQMFDLGYRGAMMPSAAMTNFGNTMANVGGQQQQLNQARLQDQFNRYSGYYDSIINHLNQYANLIASQPAANQANRSTAPSSGGSSFGNALGNAAGAAIGGMIFSDRRLKKNVKKVGSYKGMNVYEYEYKDADKYGAGKFVGVMADEVAQVNPQAVVRMPNGYDAVNYGAL